MCGEGIVYCVWNCSKCLQLEARLRRREGRMNDGIKVHIILILQLRVQATYVTCFLVCFIQQMAVITA